LSVKKERLVVNSHYKKIFKNSTKYFEFRRGARLSSVCVAYISVLARKHKLKRQSGKLKIPFAGDGGATEIQNNSSEQAG
jgi:hypothetical protein